LKRKNNTVDLVGIDRHVDRKDMDMLLQAGMVGGYVISYQAGEATEVFVDGKIIYVPPR
jgi:hypothetical protein